MYKKLFIPGPTHVVDEVLEAMAVPMIGHRDSLYSDMHGEVVEKLKILEQVVTKAEILEKKLVKKLKFL